MTVVSARRAAARLTVTALALMVLAAAALWPQRAAVPVSAQAAYGGVADNAARVAFLARFGWQVDTAPAEVVEVTLPQTFDAVYRNYNAIQRAQGLDLAPYRGLRVRRWSYRVRNYPDVADGVYADLLVYRDTVVAGDVRSVAIDGFIHGFARPQSGAAQTAASAADIGAEFF